MKIRVIRGQNLYKILAPPLRLVCLKLKDFNKTLLVYDLRNQQYLVCQEVRVLVFETVAKFLPAAR